MAKKRKEASKGSFEVVNDDSVAEETQKAGTNLPESAMGKKMAHADKKVRDKAVVVLSKWISQQTSLDEDDHLKIWKALFYCFWMSDKAPIQEELADKLAGLLHSFPNEEQVLLYVLTFYKTMEREWSGIDRLRMNKFYNLMRCMQREIYSFLGKRGWQEEEMAMFEGILRSGPLLATSLKAPGIQLHLVDVLLEELSEVVQEGMTAAAWLRVLSPFLRLLARSPDHAVSRRVLDRVLRPLAGPKWLRACLDPAPDQDPEPAAGQRMRHVNRQFRHTYIEPLPDQPVSHAFRSRPLCQAVALALAQRVTAAAAAHKTKHHARAPLLELIPELKRLCNDLGVKFTPDPDARDDDDDDDEEEAGGEEEEGEEEAEAEAEEGEDEEEEEDEEEPAPRQKRGKHEEPQGGKVARGGPEGGGARKKGEKAKVEKAGGGKAGHEKKGKENKGGKQGAEPERKSKRRADQAEAEGRARAAGKEGEGGKGGGGKRKGRAVEGGESPQKRSKTAAAAGEKRQRGGASQGKPEGGGQEQGASGVRGLTAAERQAARARLSSSVAVTVNTTSFAPPTISPRKHAASAADFFQAESPASAFATKPRGAETRGGKQKREKELGPAKGKAKKAVKGPANAVKSSRTNAT